MKRFLAIAFLVSACGSSAISAVPASVPPASSPPATAPPAVASESPAPAASLSLVPAPAFASFDLADRRTRYRTLPGNPLNIVAADINEDGKPDLVTTTVSRLGVAALLSLGDGTFTDAQDIEAPASQVVQVADLNGDGHLDVVSAGAQLAVLLGKGDGTFGKPVSLPLGAATRDPGDGSFGVYGMGLAIADIDGDKIPDLIVANSYRWEVSVLVGKGDGRFKPASTYPCPGCTSVAAADLDEDGHVDVVAGSVVIGTPGTMEVLMNDGTGKLKAPVANSFHGNVAGIAIADLDGDGIEDVVTANDASHSISVMLGKGDGTFNDATDYPAGNSHSVVVADVDLDGKLDVLSAAEESRVWYYEGTGDGGLVATRGIDSSPVLATGLVATDVNGDGTIDLALTESAADHGGVAILFGKCCD